MHSQVGLEQMVVLAETLQAPVIDDYGRMNFPSLHPLNQTARREELMAGADVILGLELADDWSTVNSMRDQVQRTTQPITQPGLKLIRIGVGDLNIKSNDQNFYRYQAVDLDIAGDVEATLPSLIEAAKRLTIASRKAAFERRGALEGTRGGASGGKLCLGRQPGQRSSPVRRIVGTGQRGRLVAGLLCQA